MYICVLFFLDPIVTNIVFPFNFHLLFLYSSSWHLVILFDTVSMFQCWLFKKKVSSLFGSGSLGIYVFSQLQGIYRLRKQSFSDKHSRCVGPQDRIILGVSFFESSMHNLLMGKDSGEPGTSQKIYNKTWGYSSVVECLPSKY